MFVSEPASATVPLPDGPTTRARTTLAMVAATIVAACAVALLSAPPARWRRSAGRAASPAGPCSARLGGDGEVSGGIGHVTVETVRGDRRELHAGDGRRAERPQRRRLVGDPEQEVG